MSTLRTIEEIKKEQDQILFELGIYVAKQRILERKIIILADEADLIKLSEKPNPHLSMMESKEEKGEK